MSHYFLTDLPEKNSIVDLTKNNKLEIISTSQNEQKDSNDQKSSQPPESITLSKLEKTKFNKLAKKINHVSNLESFIQNKEHLLKTFSKKRNNNNHVLNQFNISTNVPYAKNSLHTSKGFAKTKIAFTSSMERFTQTRTSEKTNFPGPGSYNLGNSISDNNTNLNSTMSTLKKTKVGFGSTNERFDGLKTLHDKYSPGPGEYKPEKNMTLKDKVDNMLIGKNLFNDERTMSFKGPDISPNACKYNPKKFEYLSIFNGIKNVFKSETERFPKERYETNVPGPGSYDYYLFNINNNSLKRKKTSSMFMKHTMPKINKLKLLDINTNEEIEKNLLIHKINRGITYDKYDYNTINLDNKIYNDKFNILDNKSKIFKYPLLLNKLDIKKDICEDKKEVKENMMINWKKNCYKEMDKFYNNKYIYNIIPTYKKKDLFNLNSPRWKDDKNKFSAPGPAYYNPVLTENKLSFNMNKREFIYAKGCNY